MNIREIVRTLSMFIMFLLVATTATVIASNVPAQTRVAKITAAAASGEPLQIIAGAAKEITKDGAKVNKSDQDQDCRRKMSDPYWHVYCYYRSSQSPSASNDIDQLQYDLGYWVIFEKDDQDQDFACKKLGICAHTPSGVITHPGIKEENNTWDSWQDEPLTYDKLKARLMNDVADFYNRYPNGY